mmetsp:Transcript_378/g.847  ORF Transcript_378/g.847 Transcript_378/m.847 type:complete len:504 (-) Transcript_378:68-1579(-)
MSRHSSRTAAKLAQEQQQSFFEALYAERDADAQDIIDGINLGAHAAGKDKKAMLRRKISHVLICHPQLPESHPKDFKYGRAPLLDDPEANLLELLPNALSFLSQARKGGGKVFICCAKGISRSSSMVIALLMAEKNIGFDEAFKICEQKRPIVYPNIGFQQQLRFYEGLLKDIDPALPLAERAAALKKVVPAGNLTESIDIRARIGSSIAEVLVELEKLAEKVISMPNLLQQRELWKRHGLFFENLHKYKALPDSTDLTEKARSVSEVLKGLPKIFSDSLKGVKLALAVAKELDGWADFAEPVLKNPLLNPKAELEAMQAQISEKVSQEAKVAHKVSLEEDEDEDPMKDFLNKDDDENDSQETEKQDKKDKTDKKDKKGKKEEKKKNKKDKADTKADKAQKKADKALAKIEKARAKAEKFAEFSRKQAESAAERADALAQEIARLEEEERAAAAAEKQKGKKRDQKPEDEKPVERQERPDRSPKRKRKDSSGSSSESNKRRRR